MNKHIHATLAVLVFAVGAMLATRSPEVDAAPAKNEARPLKALMITGGCCHDYESQKRILSEGISKRANVEWTIVHEGGDTKDHMVSIYKNADWAKGYDVVVHNECFGKVVDVPFVETIANAHSKGGVPAVILHCSVHSYREASTDEWRKTIGVSSFKHEKRREFDVKTVAADHPIMKGFPATWRTPVDELYVVEKFWDTATPLANGQGPDTKSPNPVIWVNQYGNARVFATTLGHGNETMQAPEYLDLVTRGLLWAAGKLDDQGKPVAGYGR